MSRRHDLFYTPKAPHTGRIIYPILLLFVLLVVIGMNFINNRRVVVKNESITIATLPDDLEKFRILHISDLHGKEFGAEQSDMAAALQTQKYNAVCITGDLCDKNGNYESFLHLIKLFDGKVPVYFIAGDEDPAAFVTHADGRNSVKAAYIAEAEALGAVYLDRPQKLTVGKSTIWFAPENVYSLDIDSARSSYTSRKNTIQARENVAHPDVAAQLRVIDYQLAALDDIERSFKEIKSSDIQIALTHVPLSETTIKTLQQWAGSNQSDFLRSVSLVLAGHYNGGQYRLPYLGAITAPAGSDITPRTFPDDKYLLGRSTIQGVTQYISPGLGTSSIYPVPVRLFNTPAVTVLTLTSTLTY